MQAPHNTSLVILDNEKGAGIYELIADENGVWLLATLEDRKNNVCQLIELIGLALPPF